MTDFTLLAYTPPTQSLIHQAIADCVALVHQVGLPPMQAAERVAASIVDDDAHQVLDPLRLCTATKEALGL